jgi:hypothetical protein
MLRPQHVAVLPKFKHHSGTFPLLRLVISGGKLLSGRCQLAKQQVSLLGAKIAYFDCRRNDGGHFVRIHLTSDITLPLAEKMGWNGLYTEEGFSTGWENMSLSTDLTIESLKLIPDEIPRVAFEMEAYSASDFSISRRQSKGKEKHLVYVLSFMIRTRQADAAQVLCGYWSVIGDHGGKLTLRGVSFVSDAAEDEQEEDAAGGLFGCAHCASGHPVDEQGNHQVKHGKKFISTACTAVLDAEQTENRQRGGHGN